MTSELKKNLAAAIVLFLIFGAGYFIFRESFTEATESENDEFAEILRNSVLDEDSRDADINRAATYICGDCAVLWYAIDHGDDQREYYAVECTAENVKEYTYIRTHKVLEAADGIYYTDIDSGCYALIDNENCVSFSGIDFAGNEYDRQISGDHIPYPVYSKYAYALEFTLK